MTHTREELQTVPLSLGIETAGGLFAKLLERDTKLPTKQSLTISTESDNQSEISILVFQGERAMARDNELIAQFELSGIPPAPRRVPQIEVTFDMDVTGVLCVTARELRSGKTQNVVVQTLSLSKEDVRALVQEFAAYSESDKQRRTLEEAQNSAESLIYMTQKALSEYDDQLTPNTKSEIEVALRACQTSLGHPDDVEQLTASTEMLNQVVQRLYEGIYQAEVDNGQEGYVTTKLD